MLREAKSRRWSGKIFDRILSKLGLVRRSEMDVVVDAANGYREACDAFSEQVAQMETDIDDLLKPLLEKVAVMHVQTDGKKDVGCTMVIKGSDIHNAFSADDQVKAVTHLCDSAGRQIARRVMNELLNPQSRHRARAPKRKPAIPEGTFTTEKD